MKKKMRKLLLGLCVSTMLILGMSAVAAAQAPDMEKQLQDKVAAMPGQEKEEMLESGFVVENNLKNASMTNFVQTKATQSSVTMSWSAVSGAYGYVYSYADCNDSKNPSQARTGRGNSLTITGLKANRIYAVAICVIDSNGQKLTDIYGIYCGTAPGKVSVKKTVSNSKNSNYTIYLSKPSYKYSMTGIRIKYYNYATKKTVTKNFSSFAPTIKLKRNAAYKVTLTPYTKIRGKIYYGSSTVRYAMKHPSMKKVRHTNSSMTVKWTKMKGVTNYSVYVKKPGGKFRKMTTTKGNMYTLKNMKLNKKYYIRVIANKKAGSKVWKSNAKDEYYGMTLRR